MLFIVVRREIPDIDGPTLISHDERGLVGVQTHARDRSIDLEEPLTLLGATAGGGGGREGGREEGRKGQREGRREGGREGEECSRGGEVR